MPSIYILDLKKKTIKKFNTSSSINTSGFLENSILQSCLMCLSASPKDNGELKGGAWDTLTHVHMTND